MLKNKQNRLLVILIILLVFIVGVSYETDYRLLTRKTVAYFADYNLKFYGGKDFRLLNTEIAFILTLIPIGFYFTTLKLNSKKARMMLLVYLILIPLYFCVSCFLESQYIKLNSTVHSFNMEVLMYHQNNLNYKTIALLTIILTFTSGLIYNRLMKSTEFKINKNEQL